MKNMSFLTGSSAVKVFDVTGNEVYTKQNIDIPLFQFKLQSGAGIYFIEVVSKDKVIRHKLVIEK